MQNNIVLINKQNIEDKIYIIREKRVMIDSDLAIIYGYTTKAFNQQVQRNIEKFDEDFMFRLTDKELKNLMSKKMTTSWGGRRQLPYAFTEQGIYMLMTVLKGELATKQSKALIRIFKEMKDYIVNTKSLVSKKEFLKLSHETHQNTKDIVEIKENIANIMYNFIDKNKYKEFLILNGERVETDLAYINIYSLAKKKIFIIDNYISLKTLALLKQSKNKDITIFTDNINNGLHKLEYDDFKDEYPNIKIDMKKINNIIHDRYIILDYNLKTEKIYHCGASSKDAGKKITTITELADTLVYHPLLNNLLKNDNLILK